MVDPVDRAVIASFFSGVIDVLVTFSVTPALLNSVVASVTDSAVLSTEASDVETTHTLETHGFLTVKSEIFAFEAGASVFAEAISTTGGAVFVSAAFSFATLSACGLGENEAGGISFAVFCFLRAVRSSLAMGKKYINILWYVFSEVKKITLS